VIEDELRELNERLDRDVRERWNRSLPLQELLSDRWQRARALGFGENASIYAASYVYGDVEVGARTWIGPFTLLDGSGGLRIGENCSISAGVQIYTHDSVAWALTGGVAEYEHASVSIGDCCHVGAHAIIVKGVTIGDHCVIGAGSFVNRDVAGFTIVAGTPCRPIGRVRVIDGDVSLEFS
jgi:acetyltransferase-like isoleucine patch superfamily enzyme